MSFLKHELIGLLIRKNTYQNAWDDYYRDEDWYFTPEAKDEYERIESLGEKTRFFMKYLCTKCNKYTNQDQIFKIAFLMAHSMVDTKYEFGGYPNILDPDKNPFINNAVRVLADKNSNDEIKCAQMLSLLHYDTEEKYPMFYLEKHQPCIRIEYCHDDGTFSDLYKIERDIITMFLPEDRSQSIVPFLYDIMPNTTGRESEDSDADQ